LTLLGQNPYPVIADNYLEDGNVISVIIRNKSQMDYDLKATVKITGPRGIVIESNEPTCMVDIESGLTKIFNRNNFEDLCINFTASNINAALDNSNLTPQERNSLLLYRILPEGSYSYCVTLKNAVNNEELITSCLVFDIIHPDRPVLNTPLDLSEIDGNAASQVSITWTHNISDPIFRQGTNYNLKIVDLGSDEEFNYNFPSVGQATIFLDDPAAAPFYIDEGVSSPNIVFLNDLLFLNGHYYAIRATAVNDDFPFPPESSQSNIHIIQYIENDIACGESFEAIPAFPQDNSIIPFRSFANIIKMNPFCENYKELNYTSHIINEGSGQNVKDFSRKIQWDKGPRKFFVWKTGIPDPDTYYSSHVSFGDYNDLPNYQRGENYIWSTDGYAKIRNRLPFSFSDINFQSGMPPVKLQSPINGDNVTSGSISLSAVHDKIPSAPLPPFKVMQIIDKEVVNYGPMLVDEVAIVQVATDETFSNVVYKSAKVISASDVDYVNATTRLYDQAQFINDIYRTLNFTCPLEDDGTYFWRLGWLKETNVILTDEFLGTIQANQLYNVSEIDSFKIGEVTSTTTVVTTEDPPVSSECISPCELPAVVNRVDYAGSLDNEDITIGKFTLEIDEINKSGTTYSGTGKIKIPFLKEVNLKVTFTNIKINTDKVIYEGDVKGKAGGNELESLSSLILGQAIELPFGLDTTINDVKVTLAYTEVTFSPASAFAQISFDFGSILNFIHESDNYPVLAAQICITPGGYSNDVILHQVHDIVINQEDEEYGFELKGGLTIADTTSMTYVRWNCRGFHSFQLAGSVLLSQEVFLKDSGNNTDDQPKHETVKGEFKFKYNQQNKDMIIAARMADFQFAEHLEGWGFDVDTFYIDLSDKTNPPNFIAPEGYSAVFFGNPATANTWKGLYIPKINVLTPKDFVNPNRSMFGVSSMILGDGIYYLRHKAMDVVNEGIMGRMSVTVDTIDAVISNIDFRFKINGKILLPFVEEGGNLAYSGMYNDLSDWNFIINVGTDSLEVDMWKAYLKLYENSYFTLGRYRQGGQTRDTLKAIMNGYISIDDELLPDGGIQGLKDIKFARIEFENLGYQSGKGFIGGAVFKKASPQKTMNGFDLQLDSIAFTTYQGNPGIYFKPKVILTGDESGFSGSVGMIFYAKINFTGNKDFISDPNLFLSDISIDAEFSSCSFKGNIKFIDTPTDRGFEGLLDVRLPGGVAGKFVGKFGNIITNPNAQKNTSSNYNYWYVDALIAFGTQGIPIFSGVNMYGIGGGLWYHMKQDANYKIRPSSLYTATPTPANTASRSNIPYTPNFDANLGLKLQGLFGDSGGGEKFNMLLTLQAEFFASGGPNVRLRGDVNVMSKISDIGADGKVSDTKKSLWGFAEIQYNGQEDFIHAQIVAYAKIEKNNSVILNGALEENKVVDAQFHANTQGDNYWYFFVGEPDQRGGIRLKLGPANLTAESYFMMGQGIPSVIPQPHTTFLAMLNQQRDDFSSSQGSLNSVLNRPITQTANGIAFGGVILFQKEFEYQPFYLDVNLVLGVDINFSHNTERTCLETGENPGHNGWYGTGQLYAGISGTFGIHIDLWFISADKELFRGSVATIMKGGLPNPSWFYCRGMLRYEIVGLIRGSHAFEMQLGEKCTIGNGNPFGDMDVITATKPEDEDTKVSVFIEPSASYAIAVDQIIEFPDDNNNYIHLKLTIDYVSLKTNDGDLNTGNDQTYILTKRLVEDNFVSLLLPNATLKANTKHQLKIKVKAKQKLVSAANWTPVKVSPNGPEWSEQEIVDFTTGPKPDSLVLEQIEITYPLQGQRFFMKGETVNSKGFIKLKVQDLVLFYTEHPITQRGYKYVMEFQPLGNNGPNVKVDAQVLYNKIINFDVSQLNPNVQYIANFKRELSYNQYAADYNFQNVAILSSNQSSTYRKSKENEYDYEILPARLVSLGNSAQVDQSARSLFKFTFKTSKYNTLKAKIDPLTWQTPVYESNTKHNIIHTIKAPAEDFDIYDMNGYSSFPSGSPNGIQNGGLIQSGIHYVRGENLGSADFSFLYNDKIVEHVDDNYFYACKNYNIWRNALTGQTKTIVQNLANGIPSFQYRMNIINIVTQHYNFVRDPVTFPVYSNSVSTFDYGSGLAEFIGDAPQKQLTFKVLYGTRGNILDMLNKIYLNRHMVNGIDIILNQMNHTLYLNVNQYINSPMSLQLEPCKPTKLGLIYKIPDVNNQLVKSTFTKNYKTPGSCVAPQID